MKVVSNEGDGAGHFAVDASSIDADTDVIVLDGSIGKGPDVLGLAASGHAVHDDNNGFLCLILSFAQPIK